MVFNHYGNSDPKCVICGERELSKLTIGHINNDGNIERKTIGGGSNFYQWLKNNGFPNNGYVIECFSCNCSKRTLSYKITKPINYYEKLPSILRTSFMMIKFHII